MRTGRCSRSELVTAIERQLDDVASLDQDRILRSYLTLIQATLRTSFFQRGQDGRPKSYVALKLDPKMIPDLPAPRPQYEIFVYSPRFEGVHLRFGPVARGGLRWSDRRDDFRTEVLGLVKAQMVKNAVIVPVGAKGGFVLKAAARPTARRSRPRAWPATSCSSRRCWTSPTTSSRRQGRAAGRRGPPRRRRPVPGGGGRQGHRDVLRHRQRDLDRATDSGWATRSPPAARPGTTTRGMGITARGAWESVKRHFREIERGHPDAGLHRGRRRRHVRRRVRQRHAAVRAHPAGGRLRPPAHLPRPRRRMRPPRSPNDSGCSTCRARPGPTTTRR